MALQDDIAADQQAVEAAQAVANDALNALDDAKSRLAAHQAALDALQPHVSLLGEMEAAASKYGAEAAAEFASLSARFKALLGL